jgi:hypothetical protein
MNETAKLITDGFKNIIKGLGTEKDPRRSRTYERGIPITLEDAEALYSYNWLAKKVVDIPIDDATRKWRTLIISDPEKKKKIEDAMNFFQVKTKISIAMKWARVFGGSVIIIVIDGENPEEPLDIEKIRPNTLKNFIVLDRYNVYYTVVNRNVLDSNYGKPDYYQVVRDGQKIHASRVIKFDGVVPTIREAERNNYWGTSIFTYLMDVIADSQEVSASIANCVYESNVDVYKLKNLHDTIATNKDEIAVKRLKLAHQMKSMINGIALDADDGYDKKSNNFASLADIDDRAMQKVSGASDIPLTRLLGISPSGMNATGESDMLNYHDNIQAIQENRIRPALEIMDSLIMKSEFNDLEKLEFNFMPLKQLTEVELADISLKNANRDMMYLGQNVIKATDILAQLSESGTYVSIDENRVDEAKKLEEEMELDLGELMGEQETGYGENNENSNSGMASENDRK